MKKKGGKGLLFVWTRFYKGCIQEKCNFSFKMIQIQIVRKVSQKEILALNVTYQKKLWSQSKDYIKRQNNWHNYDPS